MSTLRFTWFLLITAETIEDGEAASGLLLSLRALVSSILGCASVAVGWRIVPIFLHVTDESCLDFQNIVISVTFSDIFSYLFYIICIQQMQVAVRSNLLII